METEFTPFASLLGGAPEQVVSSTAVLMVIAGLLVGLGSVIGNGCTSGHGVCGISRGSARSIAATLTFMATAFVTLPRLGCPARCGRVAFDCGGGQQNYSAGDV